MGAISCKHPTANGHYDFPTLHHRPDLGPWWLESADLLPFPVLSCVALAVKLWLLTGPRAALPLASLNVTLTAPGVLVVEEVVKYFTPDLTCLVAESITVQSLTG